MSNRPRLLLPRVDVIFKLLFGDYRNADILASFLCSILEIPKDEFEKITILDPILKREYNEDKLGIVDVLISTKSGMVVHIELQMLPLPEMKERVVYYISKILTNQVTAGKSYDIMEKTISIVIVNFELVQDSELYHHKFMLYDKNADILFTDKVEINTLELHKLPQNTDNTEKYEWVQFLKSESEEVIAMLAEKNPAIDRAYAELKRLSLDEENQILYEARQRAIMDEESRLRGARNEGHAKGIAEGIEKGIAKGIEKGIAKGIAKGEAKGIEKIIINMLKNNYAIQEIEECTGYTKEQILSLSYI